MITPTRLRSTCPQVLARQASDTACSAAPIANWANRSKRRSSFFSRNCAASNPLTSQANFTGLCAASKRVIGPAPERPATRPAQVLCSVFPNGVTAPRPVIAMRRAIRLLSHLLVEVLQRLSHGAQLFRLLVRDVDIEFFLEGHHEFDRVETVGTQVLHEARLVRELVPRAP